MARKLTRAEIEARRGIVRDEQGRIIRDEQWIKERIAHLETKIGDFKRRTQNAKQEIAELQDQLKQLEGKE